jgi:hypothetical protein
LINLIPLVGGIWLLVWILEDSWSDGNRYGANPKTSPGKPDAKARLFSASVTMMIAAVIWVGSWCIWSLPRLSLMFDDVSLYIVEIFTSIGNLFMSLFILFTGIWLYPRNSRGYLSAAEICRKAVAVIIVVAAFGVLYSLWYIVINLRLDLPEESHHYIIWDFIYNSSSLLMHVSLLFFAVALLWSNRKLIRTASVVLTIAAGIMILVNAVCNMEWQMTLTDSDPLRVLSTYMSFLSIYPISLIALAGVLLSNGAGQKAAAPQPVYSAPPPRPKPASRTPAYGSQPESAPPYVEKKATILDKYRAGLSYLDGSGTFDEAGFREFNRITGNRFSNAEIENQLMNAKQMIRGMEDLKQVLRSSTVEAISVFEKVERNGIDLSKYDI